MSLDPLSWRDGSAPTSPIFSPCRSVITPNICVLSLDQVLLHTDGPRREANSILHMPASVPPRKAWCRGMALFSKFTNCLFSPLLGQFLNLARSQSLLKIWLSRGFRLALFRHYRQLCCDGEELAASKLTLTALSSRARQCGFVLPPVLRDCHQAWSGSALPSTIVTAPSTLSR